MLIKGVVINGILATQQDILQDGEYLIRVIPVKDKTVKEFTEEYFAIVQDFCDSTGNSKYYIHDIFKEELKIDSTKNISLNNWPQTIEKLKFYLFSLHS